MRVKLLKKLMIKMLSVSLTLILLLPAAVQGTAAKAEDEPISNFSKEEVVYAALNADGTVREINVVNSFKNNGSRILDYGSYTSVRNMTTTDKIEYDGGTIKIASKEDKLFYEGKLVSNEMPWTVSVKYYMDGKEYSADEIAGMSGKAEIRLTVSENTDYSGTFFDDYALQISLTLNGNKFTDIDAPDATSANVGKDKQLTYTVLPGRGIDTTIKAKTSRFELDGISFNGIKLNLNLDIDSSSLSDKVNELVSAIGKLNTGAADINTGAVRITDGGSELSGGANEVKSGAASLDNGISELNSGIAVLMNGLSALDAQSGTLTEGSSEIKAALHEIYSALSSVSLSAETLSELTGTSAKIKDTIFHIYTGVSDLQSKVGFTQYKAIMAQNGLDVEALKYGNDQAISALNDQISALESTMLQLQANGGHEEECTRLQAQAAQLNQIVSLLEGSNAMIYGCESYLNSVSEVLPELSEGLKLLNENYELFNSSVTELVRTLSGILGDMSALSDAIETLLSQYETFDTGLEDYTQGVSEIVAGYKSLASGVSSLAQGSKALSDGSNSLYCGTEELLQACYELCGGTGDIKSGISELYSQTSGMNKETEKAVEDIIKSVSGGKDIEIKSFVSDQNSDVESVQFVIKTDSIEAPKAQAIPQEEPEEMSFWQKLLKLFGL